MNENIQGKSCKVKVVPHIEFTPEQKFEFLLHNIINHKFLNEADPKGQLLFFLGG